MAYGLYGMQRDYVYIASLAPGEAACGMGALGSMAMMFVVGPICGMIGAMASQFGWWVLRPGFESKAVSTDRFNRRD